MLPGNIEMNRKALLIYNPTAGNALAPELWLGRLTHELCTSGRFELTTVATDAHFTSQNALELTGSDCSLLLAAGGDGTVRMALEAAWKAGGQIPVGIIPVGTGNQLARNLQIYDDNFLIDPLSRAVKCVLKGRPVPLDLGVMNGHCFAVAAGVGPMSDAITSPDHHEKANWRILAYASSLVQTIAKPPVRFKITTEGESFEVTASGIFISNIADLGLGSLSQTASLDDGYLDLCILTPKELQDFLEMGFRFAGGLGGDQESPFYVKKVKSLDIEVVPMSNQPSVVQKTWRNVIGSFGFKQESKPIFHEEVGAMVDGDACGTTPVHIEIAPKAVRVMAPSKE